MFGYLDSVWQLPVLYRTPGQKRMTKYVVTGPKSQEIVGVGFAWVRSLAVLEDSLGRTPASERGIETGNPTAATRAQAEVSLFNCFTPTSPGRAPTCTHTPASVSPAIIQQLLPTLSESQILCLSFLIWEIKKEQRLTLWACLENYIWFYTHIYMLHVG